MSGIDAVIAASRRAGGFAERKTFKLARSRAIEKMRKFALANPHMYVLEIIQAAVAGGAVSIDIGVDGDSVTISWIGRGHVAPDELAQLFDFLFASKDRLDLAHVRALAVGINAAMTFAPSRVIVESGDAREGAASRLEVRDGGRTVDVGRSDRRFSGTYVRLEGLGGGGGEHAWHGRHGAREFAIVESRCTEVPVPIVFNGTAMFGFASKRIPSLFGFHRGVSFDEGDLYGTIGLAKSQEQVVFKLLTFGVWIQSYQIPILPKQPIGGIVNFDRLHKTVDHSGFVRDERFEEMRLRLMPYAHELVRGKKVSTGIVRSAGGDSLDLGALRSRLEGKARVVLVAQPSDPRSVEAKRARTIADRLEAEVLFASPDTLPGVRAVASTICEVITPDVSDDRDVLFYTRRPDDPPPGPYFLSPTEMPPVPVDELVSALVGESEQAVFLARLAGATAIEGMLYAPREDGPWSEGLLVQVRTSGRALALTTVATTHPGYVLDLDLGLVAASELRRPLRPGGSVPLAEEIARQMADRVMPRLGELSERMLAAVGVGDIEPNSPGSHLVLAAVARAAIVQLRPDDDGVPVVDVLVPRPPKHFDPLSVPVVRTLSGRDLDLRGVAKLMGQGGGMLYGARVDVPADLAGLDLERVLEVDAPTESALMTIFGPGVYVRVDARDVVAQVEEHEIRDYAAGIRRPTAPSGLLDLEPTTPLPSSAAESIPFVEALLARAAPAVSERSGEAAHEGVAELRRQARIHLRHHALACLRARMPLPATLGELVLARDLDDAPVTAGMLFALLERGIRPSLLYAGGELPGWSPARGDGPRADETSVTLAVVPAVAAALTARGETIDYGFGLRFDARADAPAGRSTGEGAWFERIEIDEPGLSGTVGISRGPLRDDALLILDTDRRPLGTLQGICRSLGLSGVLRVSTSLADQLETQVAAALERVADRLWPRFVARLTGLEGEAQRAAAERMLVHLAAHVALVAEPSGRILPHFDRASADLVAAQPLFSVEGGAAVSARRLIETWSAAVMRGASERDALADLRLSETEGASVAWARRVLMFERVARPPAHPLRFDDTDASPVASGPVSLQVLGHNLERWLARLRPDDFSGGQRVWFYTHGSGLSGSLERSTLEVYGRRLDVDATHPLVTDAAAEGADRPEVFARLLAACYGRINAIFQEVGNEHELVFLERLGEVLEAGTLRMVEPPQGQPLAKSSAGDEWFGRREMLGFSS